MSSDSNENILTERKPDTALSISDEAKAAPVAPPPGNRKLYNGNFNIYWLVCGAYQLYFTLGTGMPILAKPIFTQLPVRAGFAVHLITATLVSIVCIWNLFHSPSHGPAYRRIHIWLGSFGMLCGIVSAGLGFFVAWSERYTVDRRAFAIGISVGGALQLVSQLGGYVYIKLAQRSFGDRKALYIRKHITCMHGVFYGGCFIPAMMRLPQICHFEEIVGPTWYSYSWIFSLALGFLAIRAVLRKTWY